MGHLRRCCLNIVNVLLESVSDLGRVLFALTVGTNMSTRISSMANLAGGLVGGCLVVQTLFRRSL